MATRLHLVLLDQLHRTQYCGVPGNTILDAVMQVRNAIAYSESTATPLCVLTLDFQQAFDRISHQFLFNILQAYGITPWFCERIRTIYTNVTAAIQINGTITRSFPINSGMRQGCPLSMVLYGLCLHPLLCTLERKLTGFAHRRSTSLNTVSGLCKRYNGHGNTTHGLCYYPTGVNYLWEGVRTDTKRPQIESATNCKLVGASNRIGNSLLY
jgi:hypothetical protein